METFRELHSQTISTADTRNLRDSGALSVRFVFFVTLFLILWPTCTNLQSSVQRPPWTSGQGNSREDQCPRVEACNKSEGDSTKKDDPLSRIEIVHGDIIKQKGDFIVNAANPAMMGGAGIDKAIHDAAGPQLDAYEDDLRRKFRGEPCPTGEAVLTPAFNLRKRFSGIIHTAGPRLYPNARPQPEDAMLLRSCYRKSLEIVAQEGKSSVVSPNW